MGGLEFKETSDNINLWIVEKGAKKDVVRAANFDVLIVYTFTWVGSLLFDICAFTSLFWYLVVGWFLRHMFIIIENL